jgi:hypothetical protein
MKNQFLSHEDSKQLRTMGFDEPCFGHYTIKKELKLGITDVQGEHTHQVSSPTLQQAIDFLEKVSEYYIIPHNTIKNNKKIYTYNIINFKGDIIIDSFQIGIFSTPHESKESCIREFINLVKNNIKVDEYECTE